LTKKDCLAIDTDAGTVKGVCGCKWPKGEAPDEEEDNAGPHGEFFEFDISNDGLTDFMILSLKMVGIPAKPAE
jgi:hypothetical protein